MSTRYGVLKGRPINRKLASPYSRHYHIHLADSTQNYRASVNIKSKAQEGPSILEYCLYKNFQHPITERLESLEIGFHPLRKRNGGLALDYIRGNVLDPDDMRSLAAYVPGPDNDLNELIDSYVAMAIEQPRSLIYAFGETWGPYEDKPDPHFDFIPDQGIHNIHMNQGNIDEFSDEDGTWQDGGLLFYYPRNDRWVALFLKFLSQTWHSDDEAGRRIDVSATGGYRLDRVVRISGALLKPTGGTRQAIALMNMTSDPIDLEGWQLIDGKEQKLHLSGVLQPGKMAPIPIDPNYMNLSDDEGETLSLLNAQGFKVHGISYTRQQLREKGWRLTF